MGILCERVHTTQQDYLEVKTWEKKPYEYAQTAQ